MRHLTRFRGTFLVLPLVLVSASFSCGAPPDRGQEVQTGSPAALTEDVGDAQGIFILSVDPDAANLTGLTLDADLSPVVLIDEIDPASGAPIRNLATFTRSTGPGGETVRFSAQTSKDPGGYSANWDLGAITGTHHCRIGVHAGGKCFFRRVLIDIVSSGTTRKVKNLRTGAAVSLPDGKTLPIKFWLRKLDPDGDGISNLGGKCAPDNCPTVPNRDQLDSLKNGVGDACRCLNVACGGAPDSCHLAGVCGPKTGLCSKPTKPDGSACNDGNACTRTDACVIGVCRGSNPVPCSAADSCHDVGICNTGTGQCSNLVKADGVVCNDGNSCTRGDACRAGRCAGRDVCHPAAIRLPGPAGAIPVGTHVVIPAQAFDANDQPLDGAPITYTSSDPSVGFIDIESGLFTALTSGITTITASSGGVGAGMVIAVFGGGGSGGGGGGAGSGLSIGGGGGGGGGGVRLGWGVLQPGGSLQLSAGFGGGDLTGFITWTTADPGVATVSPGGVISGIGPGTTTITGSLGGLTGTFVVTVGRFACRGIPGISSGDPHIVTYDGLQYEFQDCGEFVLTTDNQAFMVQVRQRALDVPGFNLAINSALSTRVGPTRIAFYADQVNHLWIDGAPAVVPSSGLALPGGGRVDGSGSAYTITYPNGTLVQVRSRGWVNVNVCIPDGQNGADLRGLLGSRDGNRENDYRRRDGTVVPQPVSFEPLVGDFGQSWRITAAESLFDYDPGAGPASFSARCAFRPASTAQLSSSSYAGGREICLAAGVSDPRMLDGCILDVALTGNPAYAQDIPEPGQPTSIFDFDGDHVADASDNCPEVTNANQADADGDGVGDACDACNAGTGDCNGNPNDGCETNLIGDPSNCGGCDIACGSDICLGGICAPTTPPVCAAGHANCDGSSSNGCETSLSNDANNCGVCGHSCGGGTCVNSACGAVVVATVPGAFWYFTIDQGNLYWGDLNNPVSARTMPLLGGPTTTLGKLLVFGKSPLSSVARDGFLYVAVSERSVFRIPQAGGEDATPCVIGSGNPTNSTDLWGVDSVVANGTNLYIGTYQGDLYRAPLACGTGIKFVTGLGTVNALAIDDDNLYVAEHLGSVLRVPLATGVPEALVADANAFDVRVDDTTLYFTTEAGELKQTPKTGGAVTSYGNITGVMFTALALDENYIYLHSYYSTDSALWRIAKAPLAP